MLNLVATLCVLLAPVVEGGRSQREAVAAIRQMGGRVVYSYDQRQDQSGIFDWGTPSPLPDWLREVAGDDYFFRVGFVSFGCHGEPAITAADFSRVFESVARLRSLKSFGLACTHLQSSDLARLQRLESLRDLTLDGVSLENEKLAFLFKLNGLERLTVYGDALHRDCLISIAKLPKLTTLRISGEWLSHRELSLLSSSARLDTLDVSSPHLSGDGLGSLSRFKHLRTLLVGSPSLTEMDFQHLAKIGTLERLDVGSSRFASIDDSSENLAAAKCLRKLRDAPRLRSLQVNCSLASDEYVILRDFPRLEDLAVSGSRAVDDASFEELKRFTRLKSLTVPMAPSHQRLLWEQLPDLRVYAE